VEEARAFNLWERLADAAHLHKDGQGGLLQGLTLANLSTWWHEDQPTKAWAARYSGDYDEVAAFLKASEEAEQETQRQEEENNRIQRNRLRIGLASVSTLALIATSFAWWGSTQERNAREISAVSLQTAEDLVGGLFELDSKGLQVPIKTRFALIEEREAALETMAQQMSRDPEFLEKRATFLLQAAQTLADAWWIPEAVERARQLEALLDTSEGPPRWSPPAEFRVEANLALAEIAFLEGEIERSTTFIEAAEIALTESQFLPWDQKLFELHLLSARDQVAVSQLDYNTHAELLSKINPVVDDILVQHGNEVKEYLFRTEEIELKEQQETKQLGEALFIALRANITHSINSMGRFTSTKDGQTCMPNSDSKPRNSKNMLKTF